MHHRLKEVLYFFQDPAKKSYFKIGQEVIKYWREHKAFPKQYFTYGVYRKGSPALDVYVPESTIRQLWRSTELYPPEKIKNLNNKLAFYQLCAENGLKTPQLYFYNQKQDFFIQNEIQQFSDELAFRTYLLAFLKKLKQTSLFIKPVSGTQGAGCHKLTVEKLSIANGWTELYQEIITGSYIFQETLIQHSAVAALNPSSINTLRMDAYLADDLIVYPISGLLRIGKAGNDVDNVSAGGYFVSVNLATGQLQGVGKNRFKISYATYQMSPGTNIQLAGYQLPEIESAIALVKQATQVFGVRLAGWDVAFTINGPVLIEGNTSYGIGISDMAYGGYMNHPIFPTIIKQHTK